jgi:hypothetical protein
MVAFVALAGLSEVVCWLMFVSSDEIQNGTLCRFGVTGNSSASHSRARLKSASLTSAESLS